MCSRPYERRLTSTSRSRESRKSWRPRSRTEPFPSGNSSSPNGDHTARARRRKTDRHARMPVAPVDHVGASVVRTAMTDHPFDRLARLLSESRSRRQALAALGALVAARLHPAQAASQLEGAGCGVAGAVCTMIKGCCDGLVCATSTINPNYGVCISGEGEQVAVTSQLVVPESDGVLAQLAAELAEAEADGAEGAQVIEARQSAQDTRRSKHRTRKDSKRSKKRSRRDTHQANKHGETTDTTDATTTCTGLQETCATADECCSNAADC